MRSKIHTNLSYKIFLILYLMVMYFRVSQAGVFLTKVVSFCADKCQRKDLTGGHINHREHREKKAHSSRLKAQRGLQIFGYLMGHRFSQINTD